MQKSSIYAIVTILVVFSVVGVFLYEYTPVDEVRTDIESGDVIEYTYTEYDDGPKPSWTHRMEVLNYNEDGTLAVANKVIDTIYPTAMTTDGFIAKMVPDIQSEDAEYLCDEKIDTPFGKRTCQVYMHDGDGYTLKVWVGVDSGIVYHTQEHRDGLGPDQYMDCWLTECTLFM